MAPSPPTTRTKAKSWAIDRAVSLLEVWALTRRHVRQTRRGVAAAGGVQSGARGGEGVSWDPPAAGGVRRAHMG